ncbi:MAG: histidine phosphatase family protein [Flavobacteriaceae bacterium]
MMKELVLLRHAKSSWEYSVEDRNRPLTEKGMKRIIKMAKAQPSVFSNAEIFFSSPANRALHTATLMMHTLGISFKRLNVNEKLYTFEASQIIDFINQLNDRYQKVVCVGHNPAFTGVAQYLSTSPVEYMPTSAFAQIQFEQAHWLDVSKGRLNLGLPRMILK